MQKEHEKYAVPKFGLSEEEYRVHADEKYQYGQEDTVMFLFE